MPAQNIQIWPDWRIVRELGRGSFGEVYEINRQNGNYLEKAALKVIRIPSDQSELLQLRADGLNVENTEQYYSRQVDDIRNEIGIMSKFVGYSNIVSYEDYMIRKQERGIGWDIMIRMELLTALSDYMATHTMAEEQILQLGLDISQALIICHKAGIVHRDIKPQNIFINDMGFFKLGDFGISRPLPMGSDVMSFKGSIAYMAPESFAMRNTDARSDIYALALVLYRCLNGGREPFLQTGNFGPADKEVALRRRLAGEPVPRPERGSQALCRVLSVALAANPASRYQSSRQFHDALLKVAGGVAGERRLKRISPHSPVNISGTVYLNQQGNMQGSAAGKYPYTVQRENLQRSIGRGSLSASGQSYAGSRTTPPQQNAGPGKGGAKKSGLLNTSHKVTVSGGTAARVAGGAAGAGTAGKTVTGNAPSSSRPVVNRNIVSGIPGNQPNTFSVQSRNTKGRTLVLAVCMAAACFLGILGVWMMMHPSGSGKGSETGAADISMPQTGTISSMKESVMTRSGAGSNKGDAENTEPLTGEGMDEIVTFNDPALKDAVCSSLGIGDREVTIGDALGVSRLELSGEARGASEKITDLAGIAAFENLEELDLKENNITDITELGTLAKLEWLDLTRNRVVDLTPLENLESLEWLDLAENEISSISPVTSLTHVELLDISGNQVSDISGINGMANLIGLLMDRNEISDIRPLEGLQNLLYLSFGYNNVRDISVLSEFPDLEILFMYENKIKDISVLRKLKNLEQLAVFGNPIEDESPIKELDDSVQIYEP